MQQHDAPRKVHSTINLHEYIKSKSNPKKKITKRANTSTDRPRMTYISRQKP